MANSVKQDTVEETDLETSIILMCQQNPDGISDGMIQTFMPQFNTQQRVIAVNRLLLRGRINLFQNSNGDPIYKLKDPTATDPVKGSDQQDKVVYQIIQDAGNKGIWIRDIRFKCSLLLTQVNKILKNLESKKLIKAVKSIAASKKKVYMLYNLEPDRSVTGGAWYSGQEFEAEFVEVLSQQCYKYLVQEAESAKETTVDPIAQRNGSYLSSKDVWKLITDLGISKVQLSVTEMESILDTLIYDGKCEQSIVAGAADGEQTKLYRAVNPLIQSTGLMRMPCGSCPVFHKCYEGGAVSPITCLYMKDWLQM